MSASHTHGSRARTRNIRAAYSKAHKLARTRDWTPAQWSFWGRSLRAKKLAKHAHVTQRKTGHFGYMSLCRAYIKKLGRTLTPAERAHIKAIHLARLAEQGLAPTPSA